MPTPPPFAISLSSGEKAELDSLCSPRTDQQRDRSPLGPPAVKSSGCGGSAFSPSASKNMLIQVIAGLFPPDLVVQVKALACELPAKHGVPLSRWGTDGLVRQVRQRGLVASVSSTTMGRWLHEDAIRPGFHRSWIFPRDPDFAAKACRVLDLYARQWAGGTLKPDEFVISADEKTSIQAHRRKHPMPTLSAAHSRTRRARVFPLWRLDLYRRPGRTLRPNLRSLRKQKRDRPLRSTSRESHNTAAVQRRPSRVLDCRQLLYSPGRQSSPTFTRPVSPPDVGHAPLHASWLNQIEIYFSIVQRKVLTPNDFADLNALVLAIVGLSTIGRVRPSLLNRSSSVRTSTNCSRRSVRPTLARISFRKYVAYF